MQHDAGMPHAYYEILVRLSEAPEGRLRMSELAAVGHVAGVRSHLLDALSPAQVDQLAEISEAVLARLRPV